MQAMHRHSVYALDVLLAVGDIVLKEKQSLDAATLAEELGKRTGFSGNRVERYIDYLRNTEMVDKSSTRPTFDGMILYHRLNALEAIQPQPSTAQE